MLYMIYNSLDRYYNQNNSGEIIIYKDIDFMKSHIDEINMQSLEDIIESMDPTYFYVFSKTYKGFEDLDYITNLVKNKNIENYKEKLKEFIDKTGFDVCTLHKCVFGDYLE